VRLDPGAQAGQRGQHGPVRLRASPGDQAVAALGEGVGDEVFQPAQLVPAQAGAGQVIPLEIQLNAELVGQPPRRV
jgi:hypothetical protein